MSHGDIEEQRHHFRAKLVDGMDRLGLKGYELAKLVGVDPASVTGWRQGALPRGERLADLARVLRMSPEELVPGTAAPSHRRDRAGKPDYVAGALNALSEIEMAIRGVRQRLEGKRVRGVSARAESVAETSAALDAVRPAGGKARRAGGGPRTPPG